MLNQHLEKIHLCNRCRCNACRDKCPVYGKIKFESASPRGKVMLALAILEDALRPSKSMLECVQTCTACGHCQEVCPLNVPVPDIVRDLRGHILRAGT